MSAVDNILPSFETRELSLAVKDGYITPSDLWSMRGGKGVPLAKVGTFGGITVKPEFYQGAIRDYKGKRVRYIYEHEDILNPLAPDIGFLTNLSLSKDGMFNGDRYFTDPKYKNKYDAGEFMGNSILLVVRPRTGFSWDEVKKNGADDKNAFLESVTYTRKPFIKEANSPELPLYVGGMWDDSFDLIPEILGDLDEEGIAEFTRMDEMAATLSCNKEKDYKFSSTKIYGEFGRNVNGEPKHLWKEGSDVIIGAGGAYNHDMILAAARISNTFPKEIRAKLSRFYAMSRKIVLGSLLSTFPIVNTGVIAMSENTNTTPAVPAPVAETPVENKEILAMSEKIMAMEKELAALRADRTNDLALSEKANRMNLEGKLTESMKLRKADFGETDIVSIAAMNTDKLALSLNIWEGIPVLAVAEPNNAITLGKSVAIQPPKSERSTNVLGLSEEELNRRRAEIGQMPR